MDGNDEAGTATPSPSPVHAGRAARSVRPNRRQSSSVRASNRGALLAANRPKCQSAAHTCRSRHRQMDHSPAGHPCTTKHQTGSVAQAALQLLGLPSELAGPLPCTRRRPCGKAAPAPEQVKSPTVMAHGPYCWCCHLQKPGEAHTAGLALSLHPTMSDAHTSMLASQLVAAVWRVTAAADLRIQLIMMSASVATMPGMYCRQQRHNTHNRELTRVSCGNTNLQQLHRHAYFR
jgi:hypothetical protein